MGEGRHIRSTGQARPAVFLPTAAALAVWLSGCAGSGPLRAALRPEVRRPERGVVLFLCDGLESNLLERGCREGWLPNIQRRFVAGGTRVENAITVFPAITYSAITTLLTGVSPAQHGITGNRWFDPDQHLFRNYVKIKYYRHVNGDFAQPTLYERAAPLISTSIQAAHIRGVSDNVANWAQSGVRWFFRAYTGVDALTARSVELVARRAGRRGEWPALLTCYFPGLDTVGHNHGPGSAEYRRGLVHLDHQLGRVCDWLERQGLLDTTCLVLVSDHGLVEVRPGGHIDLMRIIRDGWGLRATDRMDQDDSAERRRRYFDRFECVVAYQNGRKALLHFAGASGWEQPPPPHAVERILTAPPLDQQLWNLRGIDLVAYLAGEREVILRSRRGAARVVERDGPGGREYRYVPVPDDPLGYLADAELAAFVAAGFHESRAWLRATCRHTFPDVVPHLLPLLRQRRAGQAVVCAAPGYSFITEAGGHGGIRREERRVPMMFCGPGIEPGGTLECARAVDLVPTLLVLLGRDVAGDGTLEGVPLFPGSGVRPDGAGS